MASDSRYKVTLVEFTAYFMLGAKDEKESVENVDAEIELSDGTRWSATFMTLAEISRIMDRWAGTGENLSGAFFQCSDLVIVRRPGVDSMVETVRGIIETSGFEGVLSRLD